MDPPRVDIRMGYACNNNCRFCCVTSQRGLNLSTEQIKKNIDIGKDNGAVKIVFTGGEPTVRKDIYELVAYAKKLGFKHIVIISNGRMCSHMPALKKLVDAGLTRISYSFPDYRQDVYDYLTQVPGGYKQLMKAFENTKQVKLNVATITVINKLNYKELPRLTEELINISKDLKHFFAELVFINPEGNAWKYRDELVPKISEVAPYVHESLDIAKQNGLILNVEAIPLCYMEGYHDKVVELTMAKNRVFVDDKGANYKYNESRRKEGKVKSDACKKCEHDGVCEGVWKRYVEMRGEKELKPAGPRRDF